MNRYFQISDNDSLVARLCGTVTAAIGAAALIGWLTGWTLLASLRGDYIPMAPNTSLALLALAVALMAISFKPVRAPARYLAGLAGLLIVAISLVTIVRNFSHIVPSIDQLFFQTDETLNTFPKGHMSPITALLLLLCGASLLITQISGGVRAGTFRSAASILSGIVFVVGLVILLGYSYGTPLLYGGSIIPIAVTTAVGLVLIATGLIAVAGADAWPLTILAGPSIHARLLRIFLPLVVLAIFLDGLLIISIHNWLDFNPAIIAAVTAILLIAPISYLLYRLSTWVGGSLERANAERDLALELIGASEIKLRAIFEKSRDAITVSRDGSFFLVNPASLEMFGYEREDELIGTPLLDVVAPGFREQVTGFIDARRAGEPVPALHEARALKKDGQEFDVEASVSTYVIRGQTYTLVIVRDITERKILEQQLIQSQKMESIGRLAGGVAHDFNNYLTAVLGYTDLSMVGLPEESPIYENLKEVRVSCERLADLTHQLLLFSRHETAHLKQADLNYVVSDLLRMLGRLVGEQYSLETDLAPGLWPIDADTNHLGQIIMNLVVNARDSMPEGGRIEIRTENVTTSPEQVTGSRQSRPESCVRLSVKDEGSGMDLATQAQIFEPFFSTKGVGKGTGLGLSVVYGIVRQHHGWIEVESHPGQGSTFHICFPRAEAEAGLPPARSRAISEGRGHGERILLVEDEEVVRTLAAKTLAAHGYSVQTAGDAETALEIFLQEEGGFDLLFSDVVLPGKDGVWLMESVKELKPELPVLLASGYNDAKLETTDKRYDFLSKPYQLTELLGLVRRILAAGVSGLT